jgi:hypothetical protein
VTIRKDATIIVGTRNKISFGKGEEGHSPLILASDIRLLYSPPIFASDIRLRYSPPIFASDIRLRDSYPIFASRGGQLNGTSKCIVAPSL